MYSRIVLPTDGSPNAEAAAKRAINLASHFDADLSVIAVIESGPLGSLSLPGQKQSPESSLTEAAESFVADLVSDAEAHNLTVTKEILHGLPVSEICTYAEEIDADLIVMGSRGSGGFDRMLLGSVAEGVSRYVDIDVLLVDGS